MPLQIVVVAQCISDEKNRVQRLTVGPAFVVGIANAPRVPGVVGHLEIGSCPGVERVVVHAHDADEPVAQDFFEVPVVIAHAGPYSVALGVGGSSGPAGSITGPRWS